MGFLFLEGVQKSLPEGSNKKSPILIERYVLALSKDQKLKMLHICHGLLVLHCLAAHYLAVNIIVNML